MGEGEVAAGLRETLGLGGGKVDGVLEEGQQLELVVGLVGEVLLGHGWLGAWRIRLGGAWLHGHGDGGLHHRLGLHHHRLRLSALSTAGCRLQRLGGEILGRKVLLKMVVGLEERLFFLNEFVSWASGGRAGFLIFLFIVLGIKLLDCSINKLLEKLSLTAQ